jgi:hypothetical protein
VYDVRVPILTPRSIFKDHKERVSFRIGSTPLIANIFKASPCHTDKRKTRKSREVVFGLCQQARIHRQQKKGVPPKKRALSRIFLYPGTFPAGKFIAIIFLSVADIAR